MRSCRAEFDNGVAHQVKERFVDGIDEHVLALLRLHYRRFRLYCVVLEQSAEIGVCGGREFVCGVSGRSSCERGRRREKRCHDTKLFGGYGWLVGLVLPNGCRDRLDNRVGYGLGFRLP